MKTPYEILDVALGANDVEIKQAYLKKVKEYPPEREQQQFQLIHNAYHLIKDINSRTRYELFTIPTANFDQLLDQALNTEEKIEIKAEHFNSLLAASVDETTLLNAIKTSSVDQE